ncbi:hypothetical protein F4778DRAFT_748736 [Xylariomycetidae sp. FL2044]|nr:hypothetical protein F4778DRAFT_748736 [Xylariomycetidae sp. FL2044]
MKSLGFLCLTLSALFLCSTSSAQDPDNPKYEDPDLSDFPTKNRETRDFYDIARSYTNSTGQPSAVFRLKPSEGPYSLEFLQQSFCELQPSPPTRPCFRLLYGPKKAAKSMRMSSETRSYPKAYTYCSDSQQDVGRRRYCRGSRSRRAISMVTTYRVGRLSYTRNSVLPECPTIDLTPVLASLHLFQSPMPPRWRLWAGPSSLFCRGPC